MTYDTSHIDDYQNRLTPEQENLLVEHSNNYDIEPNICAWYEDMDDFFEAWEEVGYDESDAENLLAETQGEFLEFDNGTIIRLTR